jgi:allophanate hydrolase
MSSFEIGKLHRIYEQGQSTPLEIIEQLHARIAREAAGGVFLHLVERDQVRVAAQEVMRRHLAGEDLPLYGVPFAVKDNIDVAGLPTTAACPSYSYVPPRSAPVVSRLLELGAILIGKTNLDQFATGLVGVRSPYGAPENPFSSKHVPGGSSSGSAVAVARGYVSFALGTDTAGSGRVPAGFNNIVGLKPTRGMLSTTGLVPACRSLDCISKTRPSLGSSRRHSTRKILTRVGTPIATIHGRAHHLRNFASASPMPSIWFCQSSRLERRGAVLSMPLPL